MVPKGSATCSVHEWLFRTAATTNWPQTSCNLTSTSFDHNERHPTNSARFSATNYRKFYLPNRCQQTTSLCTNTNMTHTLMFLQFFINKYKNFFFIDYYKLNITFFTSLSVGYRYVDSFEDISPAVIIERDRIFSKDQGMFFRRVILSRN